MRKITVGHVLGSNSEKEYIRELLNAKNTDPFDINDDLKKELDLLVFWGGEDISPSLYKERSSYTYASDYMSKRDAYETYIFRIAKEKKIPMLGICRGAQLLCALNGGRLWQHVDNHGHPHDIRLTETNELLRVTSTHHQMMRPTSEMKVLGVSATILSPLKYNENGAYHGIEDEAEIVFIPEAQALCIQGHPEYTKPTSDFSLVTKDLIHKHLLSRI